VTSSDKAGRKIHVVREESFVVDGVRWTADLRDQNVWFGRGWRREFVRTDGIQLGTGDPVPLPLDLRFCFKESRDFLDARKIAWLKAGIASVAPALRAAVRAVSKPAAISLF